MRTVYWSISYWTLSYQYIFEQKKSPSEKCEGDYHAYAKQLNGP